MQKLKHDLATAESKMRMQSEALDILTAEREEIQLKLTNALQDVDAYKGSDLYVSFKYLTKIIDRSFSKDMESYSKTLIYDKYENCPVCKKFL